MNGLGSAKTLHGKAAVSELVDRRHAARLLGVSPRTLDRWHLLRIGPPRVALGGRKIRYRLSSLDAWVRSREYHRPAKRVSTSMGNRNRKVAAEEQTAAVSAINRLT